MQSLSLITVFMSLLAAQVSFAAPAANVTSPAPDSAQVDGHIYICTDANFAGDCDNYGFNSGQCSNFPSEFQDDISSVGPDSGWVCILYVDYNCNSDEGIYSVTAPGYSDLSQDWGNDAFSSFVCDRS